MTCSQRVDGYKIMVRWSVYVRGTEITEPVNTGADLKGTETGNNYVGEACSMASEARAIRKRGPRVSLRVGRYSPFPEKSRYACIM